MNNNNKKNILLTKKQQLEKQKLLLQIQKEIDELNNDIKTSKNANLKAHLLRILNYSLRTGQVILPYVISTGIIFGICSMGHVTPFIKDERKQRLEMKKEIDSLGNISYEQQYDNFNDAVGSISYIGKWMKEKDGFYSRKIETFSLANLSKDIINQIINNNTTSLEEILGKPTSSKIETKNNLTEEEIKKEPYLKAVIYSKFDDDYIIIEETNSENFNRTLLYVVVQLLCWTVIISIKKENHTNDLSDYFEEIQEKYPLIDVNELQSKIKIKQDNYNRLMRK